MTTLVLATGVPMLTAGDELGRTQGGNNNAYCQDNPISWVDWELEPEWADQLAFTRRLLQLRRDHPVFRQWNFFNGAPARPGGRKDLAWFGPEGREMGQGAWFEQARHTLGMYLSGDGIRERGPRGERIEDDSFLLLVNGAPSAVPFLLPGDSWARAYVVELDTADEAGRREGRKYAGTARLMLPGRSLQLLRALD
jgi:glycogen operon protein